MVEADLVAERIQVEQIVVPADVAPDGEAVVVIERTLDGVDGHGGQTLVFAVANFILLKLRLKLSQNRGMTIQLGVV